MADEELFADVDALESRWHTLTEAERKRADVLLRDATETIKLRSPIWRDLLEGHPRILEKIACDMTRRVMLTDSAPAGVTQYSRTTGPFTDDYTFANPTGAMFLRDDEKRLLGIGVQRAFGVDMATGEAV